MQANNLLKQAKDLDENDELAVYRDRFFSDDDKVIYLDGNSLGKLHIDSINLVKQSVEKEWGSRLIRSWNENWLTKNLELGDKIAKICGASEGEVVVSDSTSVNLYKLAHAALKLNKGKTKIVSDALNFPSDIYILEGLVKNFGGEYELDIVESKNGIGIEINDLIDAVDENTALVSLSHVVFKSSFKYNMKEITQRVHEKGALMLWDLSHSVGAVEGELNVSNADMAVGCTYKYLNGGPGSPAFLYVRKDLQKELVSPIWGWFGEESPFEFNLNYTPGDGIKRFLAGTPPIISMKAMEPTLDIMIQQGMKKIRKKSTELSEFLLILVNEFLLPLGFKLGSPANSEERGSHITLQHNEAYRICKALIDPNMGRFTVIPDFRAPDNIRFGITPLYTSYQEIYWAVMEIKTLTAEKKYTNYSLDKEQVT